jgi:hypothetical protein
MSYDILFSVSFKSLGKILDEISDAPAVKVSPELVGLIRNATDFHHQLYEDVRGLIEENQTLKREISELTREPNEILCNRSVTASYDKYTQMRDAGSTPQEVFSAGKADGLDYIALIKLLRVTFNLSLNEAKDIADSTL